MEAFNKAEREIQIGLNETVNGWDALGHCTLVLGSGFVNERKSFVLAFEGCFFFSRAGVYRFLWDNEKRFCGRFTEENHRYYFNKKKMKDVTLFLDVYRNFRLVVS